MTSRSPRRSPTRATFAWIVLGAAAWLGLAALAAAMYGRDPNSIGFDLELLLLGGRRVAQGISPYDAGLVGGGTVAIESLFYSYPPLVAQAMSVLASVPVLVVLVVSAFGAGAAAVLVAGLVERRLTGAPAKLTLPTAALLPLWFPFAIALLFGNLDAWFPALFGLLLVGALAAQRMSEGHEGSPRDLTVAGLSLALVAITKLHPASLGLWFLIRGARERSDGAGGLPPSWRIAAVAAVAGLAAIGLSLAVGDLGPWADYLNVLRAGMNVDLIDSRNLGPAAQIALVGGLDPSALRLIQVGVTAAAIAATAYAAWRLRDPIESLAWATVASFVVLPVTWFHYPAALVPFAVAAVARADGAVVRRRTVALAATALLLGIVGIGQWIMWLALAVLLVAIHVSRPVRAGTPAPSPATVAARA
jgi:hypothetical protein